MNARRRTELEEYIEVHLKPEGLDNLPNELLSEIDRLTEENKELKERLAYADHVLTNEIEQSRGE